jgi:TonB-linked SusC/RagA family outer membrane protein
MKDFMLIKLRYCLILQLLVFTTAGAWAQGISVKGRVTDNRGEGLPGVTVLLKGTTNGTATDATGAYTLTGLSGNGTLVVSFIGYLSQEVAINNRTTVNITLLPDTKTLEEVVVVGFGEQKKVNLTGAISTVESAALTAVTTGDISNALTGKLPGLRVMQVGGEPGTYDNRLDIRGWGNMLVVIDGVPREDFQRLDPGAIASVTILKDASAAVYGVKAANGVMLITTKQGQAGKSEITLNATYGFEKMTEFPKPIRNAMDNLILKNEAALVAGNPLPYPDWQKYTGEDPNYPNVDWWDLTVRETMPISKNNLSFSGGNNKVTYFLSLGNLHQEGLYRAKSLDYNRYNFQSNLSAEIVDNLKATVQFGGFIDERNSPFGGSSFDFFKQVWMQPGYEPIYANNTAPYYYDGQADRNPLAIIDPDLTGYRKYNEKRYQTTFSVTYDLPSIKGLQVKGLFAYDLNYNKEKLWRKAYNEFKYNQATQQYTATGLHNPTRLQQIFDETGYTQSQLSLNYKNSFFGGKHGIQALLLGEQRSGSGTRFVAQRNFAISALEELDAGLTANQAASGRDKVLSSNMGLVGRLNYDFAAKYLAEFSFRYDGSSLFPENSRWGFFPAFSAGWRISEEPFFKHSFSFVDNLKLRASHGVLGDDSGVNGFQYLEGYRYPSGSYIFDGRTLTGGSATWGLPNPNITWFTATTSNAGLDGSLWQGLVDFQLELFQRKREGLLATRAVALPGEFGATLPQENLESDLSRGLEVVLGHTHMIRDFSYSVRTNFTFARTRWLHREAAPAGNRYDQWRNRSNNRWKNIRWGYGYEGQFQNQDEIDLAPVQNAVGHAALFPGDIRYEDWNQDGMISELDEHPIGRNVEPEIFYGLDLSGGWKGFSLSLFFQGASNYSMMPSEQLQGPLPWGRNSLAMFLDRWHHQDPLDFESPWVPGKYPITRDGFGFGPNKLTSTYWVQDVTYLRLKSLELAYSLPLTWANRVKARQVRLYANAFNVHTWKSKNLASDPEHRLDGDGADGGYRYPLMANYNLGLNITF